MPIAAGLPKVLVLVGLPGSGKSSWAESLRLPVLSSDDVRRLLKDDANDQTIHGEVFATMRYLLRRRLELRRPVTVIDATNLTPKERQSWVAMAGLYGAVAEAVLFDTPPEVCKQRSRGRQRVVPDEVIDLMAAKLVPPTLAEGFAQITVIPTTSSL
ncbi:MAG: ATP-binding protein [Bryobacteraceae bacterium]|nr:ATP-binding protein [Bryobacteraceae bacterium]